MTKAKRKDPIICAFDTETDYSTEYSIDKQGSRGYVKDPRFKCYLCTFANDDFTEAEAPEDIDWLKYEGATFIAHNAAFDQRVFEEMQERKIIPPITVTFICSMDMCGYFQLPQSLAGAVFSLFKVELAKGMRDWMKNKSWQDAVDQGKAKELIKYGVDDAIWCWKVYKKLYKDWPAEEKVLSQMTREMTWHGMPIDVEGIKAAIAKMEKSSWEIKQKLPWVGEVDPDTKKEYAVQSKKGLAKYLRKIGLSPPTSVAQASVECLDWIERFGDQCSYVSDFQKVTSAVKHLKFIRTMGERTEDGRMTYGMRFYGTNTLRWSGRGFGWNCQGIPKGLHYGIDIRSLIKAPEGHKLIIADLAAIEPRCTGLVIEDDEFLDKIRNGLSPYQAHAELTMGWSCGDLKTEDPELYALAKQRTLSLGYGSGWKSFMTKVKENGLTRVLNHPYDKADENAFLTYLDNVPNQSHFVEVYDKSDKTDRRCMVNAWIQVMDFRKKHPRIKGLWDSHGKAFKLCAQTGEDYTIELLSGRTMKFFRPRVELDGTSCTYLKGGRRRFREYGSSLFQKSIQCTARDIFANCLYNLHISGLKVVLHVHDEVVVEVKEDDLDESMKLIKECMTTPPDWAKRLPLESSMEVTERYKK